MEKASFDRLNKLFEIFIAGSNHKVLLTDRNLLAMVKKSKSFIIPILPCLAPQALVPDEHHVLKDLSCYEVGHAVDSKACQDLLEQRKKKSQEGKLRQAPATSRPTSNSVVRFPAKKKGPVIQPIQRPPNPPHASPAHSASTSASSYSVANTELEAKVKSVVSPIIYEEEE